MERAEVLLRNSVCLHVHGPGLCVCVCERERVYWCKYKHLLHPQR